MQEQETASMKRSAGPGESSSLCKDGGECSSSGTLKKTVSRESKKSSHHWLPSIHEDYYGPRTHKPKHH